MKNVPFHFRNLLMMITIIGSLTLPDDVMGQVTSFDNNCPNGANATADCSAAIGDNAAASADYSVAIGTSSVASATDAVSIAGTASGVSALSFGGSATGSSSVAIGKSTASGPGALSIGANAIAYGDDSYAFGEQVKSSATNAMVFGRGISGVSPLDNGDASTLMLGMNSNVPTFYLSDAGGSPGAFSNIGIATTSPSSRLHVNGDVRLGVASVTIGRTVWHNATNTNTVTLESGTTTSSYTLKLPVATGSTNDFLQLGASGQLQWASAGSVTGAWMLIGNSGTNAASNFLGTTDAVDLVFRTANTEKVRVTSGGNVGIGTSSPTVRLHVLAEDVSGQEPIARFSTDDAIYGFLQLKNQAAADTEFAASFTAKGDATNKPALQFINITDHDAGTEPILEFDCRYFNGSTEVAPTSRPIFQLRVPGTGGEKLLVDANGNLGVGTTSPSGRLDVNGTVFINYSSVPPVADPNNLSSNEQDLGIDASTGQLINLSTSSIHYKENVEDIQFDHEAFLNLRAVDFKWKEYYGGGNDVGMIAQEVAEDFPALASWSHKYTHLPDGSLLMDSTGVPVVDETQLEVSGVRYHKLPVYLFSIVKEQYSRMEQLEQQVQELTTRLDGCCTVVEPMNKMDGGGDSGNGSFSEFVLLRNDPNPFSDYTDVQYEHDGCTDCQIIITDVSGRIIKRILTEGTKGTVRVYSSEIGSGMFIYSLVKDGKTVSTERMISSNR